MSLRDLAAERIDTYQQRDRWIALVPELAVLAADMADTLTEITEHFIPGIDTHENTNAEELLARFEALDTQAGTG